MNHHRQTSTIVWSSIKIQTLHIKDRWIGANVKVNFCTLPHVGQNAKSSSLQVQAWLAVVPSFSLFQESWVWKRCHVSGNVQFWTFKTLNSSECYSVWQLLCLFWPSPRPAASLSLLFHSASGQGPVSWVSQFPCIFIHLWSLSLNLHTLTSFIVITIIKAGWLRRSWASHALVIQTIACTARLHNQAQRGVPQIVANTSELYEINGI